MFSINVKPVSDDCLEVSPGFDITINCKGLGVSMFKIHIKGKLESIHQKQTLDNVDA